jgi:hypothetical protein
MSILRVVTTATIPLMLTILPFTAPAQLQAAPVAQASAPAQGSAPAQTTTPTQAEVQAAVKKALQSVDLTMPQMRQIRPMIANYKSQTANADAATKKAAKEKLLEGIYGVLTPAQQAQFKASLKQSLGGSL